MSNTDSPRRPSNDLTELRQQILSALAHLENEGKGGGEPDLYLAYLNYAQTLAWRGVARNRPDTPRIVLDYLLAAQPFLDTYLPEEDPDPRVEAALNLSFAFRSLYLADESLEGAKVESVLSDRERSLTEREVLRVLLTHRDRYLRRGEVLKLLRLLKAPTAARISQILGQLNIEDAVVHMPGRAQGNPNTTFYALSPQGFELCHRLGLDRRWKPYFSLEEDAWKPYLTPERIAASRHAAPEPGRIIAFWSHRGGIGRTTTVAGTALALARRMRDNLDEKVLVIDLNLESPGLDMHFAPNGLGNCRGLRGLTVDFNRVPRSDRASWLHHALQHEEYVLQPSPQEYPNLFYLSSGFGPGISPGLDEERSEAWAQLEDEGRMARGELPEREGDTFISILRRSLDDLYSVCLLDPQVGFGLTAWAALLQLADSLVLCLHSTESDPHPLRAALGNFLQRRAKEVEEVVSRVIFLRAPVNSSGDLSGWIERRLLQTQTTIQTSNQYYRISTVDYDRRAASINLNSFGALVRQILGAEVSPEIIDMALTRVREGGAHDHSTQIAEGLLANVRNPECVAMVRSKIRQGTVPPDKTRKLIRALRINQSTTNKQAAI